MTKSTKNAPAFVASVIRPHSDPYLSTHGFCQGMVIFALPDYGVQFKCQAEGRRIDLEFGAFFSLLRFVEASLAGEKITAVTVYSSFPEFVFACAGKSRHMEPGSDRQKLLAERTARLGVTVSYVEPHRNLALLSPVEYPSMPEGKTVAIKSKLTDPSSRSFRPIQKGIRV